MEINYVAVLACGVLAMVVGFIWYGPLFGKKWLRVMHADTSNVEARKEMQKKAMPLYFVQFVLTLFQAWVLLTQFISMGPDFVENGVNIALWAFAGFVIPIVAGNAMWNNDSREIAWTRFLIQAGYQLVLFILFGYILGAWGLRY